MAPGVVGAPLPAPSGAFMCFCGAEAECHGAPTSPGATRRARASKAFPANGARRGSGADVRVSPGIHVVALLSQRTSLTKRRLRDTTDD